MKLDAGVNTSVLNFFQTIHHNCFYKAAYAGAFLFVKFLFANAFTLHELYAARKKSDTEHRRCM